MSAVKLTLTRVVKEGFWKWASYRFQGGYRRGFVTLYVEMPDGDRALWTWREGDTITIEVDR